MALIDAIETDEPWIAYCKDYLPRSTNAAIIWDEDEIDELQIPAVVEQAQALSERCIDTYKERFKATEADDEAEEADEKLGSNGAAGRSRTPSLDEWKWAFSMVYSRSFSLEESRDGGKGPLRAMAPFVDMFNHVPESPAEYAAQYDAWEAAGYDEPPSPWRLERAGQAADESAADYVVSLYADRAVASGEEIRVPYGIETTGECLCTSGFVPDDNSADYATIFADPVEMLGLAERDTSFGLSAAQAQRRLNIFADLDAVDAPLAARPGALDASAHVLACARLAAASDDELAAGAFVEDYVASIGHFTLVPAPGVLSHSRIAELDAAAAAFCAEVAETVLAELPTTLAEDEALLAGTGEHQPEPTAARLDLALRYRLSVKRLLAAFIRQCQALQSVGSQS